MRTIEKRRRHQPGLRQVLASAAALSAAAFALLALSLCFPIARRATGPGSIEHLRQAQAAAVAGYQGVINELDVMDGQTLAPGALICRIGSENPSPGGRAWIGEVRAPQAGIFSAQGDWSQSLGRHVAVSDILGYMVAQQDCYFLGQLRPQDIEDVKVGQPCKMRIWARGNAKVSVVEGTVTEVGRKGLATAQGIIYQVQCRWDEAGLKGRQLFPGMQGTLSINVGSQTMAEHILGKLTR
jgi:hypothetical protein